MSAGSQLGYSFLSILGLASSVSVFHFFPSGVSMPILCALLTTQIGMLRLLNVHSAQRWSRLSAQSFAPFSRLCELGLAMCESLGFEVSSHHSWQPIIPLPSALVRRHAWRASGRHTRRAGHARRWEWHTSGRRSGRCSSGWESGRHALRNMWHSGHAWRVLDGIDM